MMVLRKIALLGGSGFIGTRLTSDLLQAGHDVMIGDIVRSNIYPDRRIDVDVRDFDALVSACAGYDVIINLAAVHRDDVRPVSLYYDTNVTGARMVCQAAEKLDIRTIVFTSSVAVYGHQEGEPNEDSPHNPIGPYGETKSQAEIIYKEWYSKDSLNRKLVIIRPTVVFGKGNRGNVYNLMAQVTSGHFVMVGNGQNRKSMAYVENVAAFLAHSLSSEAGVHIFNYIDKPDINMNEFVELVEQRTGCTILPFRLPCIVGRFAGTILDFIARISGRIFPISRVRIEKFCATTVFSAERVRLSGFVAPTELNEALIETIEAEFGRGSPKASG